eukprot:GHVP01063323.1.p1 GENE.GHVP01063323.1~~GHVP01063323.1.p1  ORF type:complete len:117 (-),score=29.49 GHVP01063323.1:593-943(-)
MTRSRVRMIFDIIKENEVEVFDEVFGVPEGIENINTPNKSEEKRYIEITKNNWVQEVESQLQLEFLERLVKSPEAKKKICDEHNEIFSILGEEAILISEKIERFVVGYMDYFFFEY